VVLEDPAINVRGGPPERRQQTMQNYIRLSGLSRAETEQRLRASATPGWTEADVQGKIDAAMKTLPASVQAVFDEKRRLGRHRQPRASASQHFW
jgi:hypothetical protein